MSDVDKLQVQEEAAAQREEQKRTARLERDREELRERPLRITASKPRASQDLRLEQVHPGDNIRTDLPEIQELALSVRELGLLTPLLVRPWDDDAKADGPLPAEADLEDEHYRLVAGHRRYAALQALVDAGIEGFDEVRCEVRPELSEAEAYALMLTENVQRVPLEPVQAARALRLLLDLNEGLSVAELARSLGLRPGWAQVHLKLLDLPQEVLARVETGDLSMTIADLLRRAQGQGRVDEKQMLDLAAKAAAGEITSAQVRKEAGPPPTPNTVGPKTVAMGPDGRPMTPLGPPVFQGPPGQPSTPWPTAWREDAPARMPEYVPKVPEDVLAAPHPGAERMAEAQQVRKVVQPTGAGEALGAVLDSFLLGKALQEWADDEYLADLGIEREDAPTYAVALGGDERLMALRHLSLAIMQSERSAVAV